MDWKIVSIWLGSIIALLLYYPLVSGILKKQIEQSFATWVLWVALDLIALVSVILQHGNYAILVCYCLGGTAVSAALIYMRQFRWTWFENCVLAMVIVCLVAWYLTGSRITTIISTIAVAISGLPQLRDAWLRPDRQTAFIYLGYVFANGFSFLGGKAWTIEDRFYPGVCTILCAFITAVAFRKPTVVAGGAKC